ncbi:acyl-CoA synthetase [uncultured Enterovirga sp.]|uniref:acyl-CoA synthetase n=1 Tax=uncultured Enterovirga sp. TaxID=2026352 RepID=UPI0035CCA70A
MFGHEWKGLQGGRLTPPARFNFAGDVIHARGRATPDRRALISVGPDGSATTWTYRQVSEAVGRLAGAMRHLGVGAGDRVLLLMPRTGLWLVALGACHHLGAIPVPCVTQIGAGEVAYRVDRSGATAAISSGELLHLFEGLHDRIPVRIARDPAQGWHDLDRIVDTPREAPDAPALPADAPALMYFTSGSSGLPKAVVHGARAVFVRSWQPWVQFGIDADDVIWTTSDPGWTRAGSCLLYGSWFWGATSLIVERSLTADDKVRLLDEHRVSVFSAVATELRQIIGRASPRPLPRLRFTISAGEAMTAELSASWSRFSGSPLIVGYGQTETCTSTLTDPGREAVNGMIGAAIEGNAMAVLDDEGRPCPAGVHGEIAFLGDNPGLMLGYWQDGQVVPAFARDGWHRTGDAGYQDETGHLYFVGRADDVISSSGYRIGPTEVENALMLHPAVQECAVAAAPDDLRGEVVKAFVVLRPGLSGSDELAKELQDHVKAEIAPYKYPRRVAFVAALPRTASGKISRRALRLGEPASETA